MKPKPTSPNLPAHGSRRYFAFYAVFGAVFVALGAAFTLSGHGAFAGGGPALLLLGAIAAGLGVYGLAIGAGVQAVNSSLNLIGLGRLGEAEALLDWAERSSRIGLIHRVADVQRAIIAMRRGDVAEALRRIDSAVERPLGVLGRMQSRLQAVNARGIRALLRASRGDEAGARDDVAAVRAGVEALPQSLARAALAEAILLERAGRRDDLRALIARERKLLFEATEPRERAIVRAYQRMLEARATTVYREPSRRDGADREEPPLADWVAKIAPGAAPFVLAPRLDRAAPAPAGVSAPGPSPAARDAVARARAAPSAGRRVGRLVAIWAALVACLVAIASILSDRDTAAGVLEEDLDPSRLAGLLSGFVIVAVAAIFTSNFLRGRAQLRKLQAGMADLARGEEARGRAALEALTRSRLHLVAAQAHLQLAVDRERACDFGDAMRHCDAGLARASHARVRIAAADLILPMLAAERAFVLCALGRADEARAELALLPPAFPFLGRARFRVELLDQVRRGDLAAAARAGEQALDLPLGAHDELLADVVRAAAHPELVGAGEIQRLKKELRAFAEGRRWLDAVAPGLAQRLEAAPDDDRAAEADAEAEAEREADAAAALARPGRLAAG